MAFVRANLERVGGGRRKLFIYAAGADTVATVTASGYFNSVASELDQGDVIMVVSNNNAAVDNIVVTSADRATTVTTSAVEGSTAT